MKQILMILIASVGLNARAVSQVRETQSPNNVIRLSLSADSSEGSKLVKFGFRTRFPIKASCAEIGLNFKAKFIQLSKSYGVVEASLDDLPNRCFEYNENLKQREMHSQTYQVTLIPGASLEIFSPSWITFERRD